MKGKQQEPKTRDEALNAVKPNLRISRFQLGSNVIIVNTNYRFGVGFRAAIEGQPGKWGDSEHSPEAAIGRLILNWLAEELKATGRQRVNGGRH